MTKTFNDPLFSAQWYLLNTGQRGGDSRLDINILSAWENYTGKGIVIAVNDDGMDLTHPSIASNLLINLAYDGVRKTTGQGFVGADNSHGTVVGSIVGMAGNDGVGGVGVAYEAKIVPGLAIAKGVNTAQLFLANLAAGAAVSVNSWGSDPAFAENFGVTGSSEDQAWGLALLRAATEARGNLGMVIAVSGGNERGNNADTALTSFTNSKLTIAVGAITETGAPTSYSTKGASLLLTAPGGVGAGESSLNSGFGIVSADVQGTAGYNTTAGVVGDYTYQNEGTSYSGPMVGGAAALMLQANPTLGFRDVSTILALTARKVDSSNTSWVQNSATDWNLGGMHFSRDFGYGLLDVSAAVRLAESWALPSATVANWRSAEGISSTASNVIPDASPSGLTVVANLANNLRIERMEFDLELTAASPSQLSAVITSPGGTRVTLFDQPLTRSLVDGTPTGPETAWPATFTIGSTAFLGENSAGNWSLQLVDKVNGETATYYGLTVRAWGTALTADTQYLLTNEFAAVNPTINDASGSDTLNAAAVDSAVRLDLRESSKSTLAKGEFTISAGSVIENAIGGLGADTLTGNVSNNQLRGNAGNDTLDGGAGTDTAIFSGNQANYTVSKTGTGYILVDKKGADGTDTLLNIEAIKFTDKTVNLTVQAKAASAPQADVTRLVELYTAFFNRIPDADGMSFWIDEMKAGKTTNQVAEAFYNAGVNYSSLTGFSSTMKNADFINVIYKNVLGRKDGADAGGLSFWEGEITSGRASRGTLVTNILDSAHTFKGDATWGWVADLLDNKITVAKKFSIDMGLNYNTPEESITKGMAIASAITPTDTSAAVTLIGVTEANFLLV